jgi:hypothetical protein
MHPLPRSNTLWKSSLKQHGDLPRYFFMYLKRRGNTVCLEINSPVFSVCTCRVARNSLIYNYVKQTRTVSKISLVSRKRAQEEKQENSIHTKIWSNPRRGWIQRTEGQLYRAEYEAQIMRWELVFKSDQDTVLHDLRSAALRNLGLTRSLQKSIQQVETCRLEVGLSSVYNF